MGNQANTKESKSIPEPKTVSELRPISGQKAVSEIDSFSRKGKNTCIGGEI